VDGYGWKIPSCLFVVYDSDVGQTQADWTVPFFWKPFWSLPATIVLGLVIPAVAAFAIGYFVFRSRVRGVYFAILTQAIAVAAWMVFSKNEMMLGGTNGLTAFDHFTFGNHERIEVVVVSEEDLKAMEEGLDELQRKQAQIVGKSMSASEAGKRLEDGLAAHFLELTEAVGHLPSAVEAALQKVDKKINACVEAFQSDEKQTLIETALDELGSALEQASTATKHALVVRPDRLKEVQVALERRRKEKRVTVTKEVDGKLYVHRNFKLTDGNETSPKSEGMELQIPFGGQDPDRSYALTLEQSGVDEEWEVALNDQNIGNLKRGPPQDIRLSVPSGVLKASENNLIIRPVTPHVQDEIEIGRIRLAGDVPPLGGTLEQKGDNFLSVPEFGVNLNKDYNVLVIHADPANADKIVELQDWASVKYLGPRVKGDSVKLILYVLSVLALFGAYFLCRWIVRSRLGRVLVAIRDDESTLRFFGYRPYVYKLFAFCVAAALAGLGGMLYVPQMTITTPTDMEASMSILIVVWVAVGGRGTLVGAIFGALTVNLLYNYFTSEHDFLLFTWKSDYWQFILGGLFVSVVLFFPQGLMSLPEKFGLSQKIADLWAKLIHGRQS
jgi:ABC-type branched-subunit amino acid transport system permease subunit